MLVTALPSHATEQAPEQTAVSVDQQLKRSVAEDPAATEAAGDRDQVEFNSGVPAGDTGGNCDDPLPTGQHGLAACVQFGQDNSFVDDQPSAARALATPGLLPLPDWCVERAFTGWWFKRTQACMVREGNVIVEDLETGAPVGDISFLEINLSYTSGSIETWAQQIEIRMFAGVGLVAGTTVRGDATCTGACAATRSNFPSQPVLTGRDEEGEAFYDTSALAPGAIGFANTQWTYEFTNPEWVVQPLPFEVAPPRVRCDNAIPGTVQPGCVFPDYMPADILDRGGAFNELARHIGDAQLSGLPGAYPDGVPLKRLVDPVAQNANRTRACPDASAGGYPRPEGKSCDEYPFASTKQGAAQPPRGPARTFSYCQINEPAGAGPIGYSVCMIDATQNSVGGSLLGSFYNTNRVIDDDPFQFWITGGLVFGQAPIPGGGEGGGDGGVPNSPPTANAGPDVKGNEGAPIRLRASARDAESDVEVDWSYSPRGDVDAGATCRFDDAHTAATTITCTDDGTFDVTLTVSDGSNAPVSDSAVVRVSNVSPSVSVTGPAAWQLFKVGTTVGLTAPVTDPGSNDTHSCTVSWDDGAVQSFPADRGTCDQTHVFAHAGMYTVTVTVTDDDGGTGTASVLLVVFDPNAGWINLDGSTLTPAGALVDTPNASQWTWVHLDAHYYTQTGAPTGVAKSWVPQTPYRMESTALQWLVVTPDGKIAVRGTATGQDGSALGFVFYGYHGCPAAGPDCQVGTDRMRLVVWRLSAGPNPGAGTVYDNQPSAGYDIDVVGPQPLNSGAVQIHH